MDPDIRNYKKKVNSIGKFFKLIRIYVYLNRIRMNKSEISGELSKHFEVDEHGPYFNKNIQNHNLSSF
jgi:hypothetical protein